MEDSLPCSEDDCYYSSEYAKIEKCIAKGATKSLFTRELFQMVLGCEGTVISWKEFTIPSQKIGLTSACKARESDDRLLGHIGFEINFKPSNGKRDLKKFRVVAKCKPLSATFVNIFAEWIKQCGDEVGQYSDTFKQMSYFRKSDVREVEVMREQDRRFTDIAPTVYYTECALSQEIFVIVMEDLTGHVTHLDTINDAPVAWKQDDIKVVLRDIARFHSIHLDEVKSLMQEPWICVYSGKVMKQLAGLWSSLLQWNHVNFPQLWTAGRKRLVGIFIENLHHIWKIIESFPRTLVHYDFTPRNVCIRKLEQQDACGTSDKKLTRLSCIYDWEMATVHVPQHDVVEFLAFALPAECDVSIRENLVQFYQKKLEKFSGRTFDSKTFLDVFNVTCCDYALHQLCLKTVTHSAIRLPYFERAVRSHLGYLENLNDRGSLDFLKSAPCT